MRKQLAATVAVLVCQLIVSGGFSAQTSKEQPLFTQVPQMCYAGPYVAMLPLSSPSSLVLIPIGPGGIAEKQTISTAGNGVIGMKCATWGVELLVRENGSDHLSRLPFRVENGVVVQEPRRLIDWVIPKSAETPVPREVEREMDNYHQVEPRGIGNWFVRLPRAGNPEHNYFVHLISTEKRVPGGLESTLIADLLEKTYEGRVTKSIALVRSDVVEGD